MAHDRRTFQPVTVGLSNLETGQERFLLPQENFVSLPPFEYWRVNLTALSQRYNLYFIASQENILVYQPDFPLQKLKGKHQLLIPPTISNTLRPGYLNEARPHCINHLVVGDLGTEEIILVATDSGNVAAYYTNSILAAIEKGPYKYSAGARSDCVGLRAFFSQCVTESAWGLAVHAEGRMIAVSENSPRSRRRPDAGSEPTAKITVFAFALHTDIANEDGLIHQFELTEDPESMEWHDWRPEDSDDNTPTRQFNYRIVLHGSGGHYNNIPSIAFVNTQEDRAGEWLLSTDIMGKMKLWRIWRGACFKTWDFGSSTTRLRDPKYGWLVAALDRFAFRPATSVEQFCGRPKAIQYQGHRERGVRPPWESYDLTNIVRSHVPGNSQVHPALSVLSTEDEDENAHDEVLSTWSHSEDDVAHQVQSDETETVEREDDEPHVESNIIYDPPVAFTHQLRRSSETSTRDETRSDRQVRSYAARTASNVNHQPITFTHRESSELYTDASDTDESRDEEESLAIDETYDFAPEVNDSRPLRTTLSSTTDVSDPDASDDDSEVPVFEASSDAGSHERCVETHEAKTSASCMENCGPLPCIPTIHCSKEHLRLLNAPVADTPHVFCANLLKQMLPNSIEETALFHMDRLCMLEQISELGIVIIASQIGRCAVCSLTRRSTGTLGIRVDWTLPTQKQERERKLRPETCLIGIAVGPIQGRLRKGKQRAEEDEDHWSTSQNIDLEGVSTSFDPSILVLSAEQEESASHQDSRPPSSPTVDGGTHKRKRQRSSSGSSPSSHAATEHRAWPRPVDTEPWQGVESSRRYRLMMTYADMSVLTYEISRGVEKEDTAAPGVSALDLLD